MTVDAEARLGRARELLAGSGAELLAVGPTDSLRYLTGLGLVADERTCLLLLAPGAAAFVVPRLNSDEAAPIEPFAPRFAWEDHSGPGEALAAALAHLGGAPRRAAVDPEMAASALLDLLGAAAGAEAESAAPILRALRERKGADEVAALRDSAATADAAMRAAIAACRVGATELQVAAAARAAFTDAGAEEVCFTAVGSGPNGALPHHELSARELRAGEPVVIDIGGKLDGYASDITRMAFVGEPTEKYLEVHGIVERAVVAALAAARPGATCGEVDAAARSTIAAAGYGEHFLHRTGHGIGLSTHEPPWIMAGEDAPLAEGMVFSIEPGIYLPGEFGVRLEEIVHVGAEATQPLSALTRELEVVP
ncbi:MAG: M24 family metallopeptidase [Actinobacteria bacterium]|nr:M24 family metallopeptidase [Actinomycetota bacterium]